MKKEKEKDNSKKINTKNIKVKQAKQQKKSNLNPNSKRIIFWTVIWVVILICSFAGYWAFDNGYGDSGKIRAKLKPIVNNFNNLNGVKQYNTAGIKIEPKLTKNSIVINYITSSSKASFNFEYVYKENKDTLYLKYSSSDETTANAIIILMLDAVSISQGHKEGDLFSNYSLDMFENTNIVDGVQLIKNANNTKEIYINLNNSLLDNNQTKPSDIIPEDIIPNDEDVPEENLNNENDSENIIPEVDNEQIQVTE